MQSIERALARGSLRRRFLELPGVAPGARGQAGARWLTVRLRFLALNQSSLDCGVATSTRAGGSGTFTEMGFANVGQGMHCCIIIGFSDRFVRPAPGGFLPSRRVDRRTAWARTVRSPQKTLGQFQQMVHEDCRNRFRRPCLHSSESNGKNPKRKASSTELARGRRCTGHRPHSTSDRVRRARPRAARAARQPRRVSALLLLAKARGHAAHEPVSAPKHVRLRRRDRHP